jgi:DNA/RNA-binding protein KIN17
LFSAEIIAVHNDYIAELKVSDTGDILKIDQSELETVLPALDRPVKVVNGSYRGQEAQLIELVTQDFCATIKLLTGPRRGTTVSRVPYEDICKLA